MSWNHPPQGYNPTYNPSYGGQQQYGQHQQQQNAGYYQQYGGPPTHSPYGGAPPQGPPPGVDPTLWHWFQAVDQDRSGKITAAELRQALVNSNWSHFNEETCRLMIGMFDKDKSGTIDVHEFSALWQYIQQWKNCFDGFDRDRSGTIDSGELNQAFATFGYRLSPQFCNLCVQKFDRGNRSTMKFDDFIQCCVTLKSLTDAFRQHDRNQSGMITINYEQFLEMVLAHTLTGI